ncbi:hypothetical protein Tco_1090686 [Tanacetum coccineum]|uniref:Uncharacterized protein n=1 Tax=Tanacetum coccineum TaxID=301880 RepID=A0ABQ5I6Z4_9ASTR
MYWNVHLCAASFLWDVTVVGASNESNMECYLVHMSTAVDTLRGFERDKHFPQETPFSSYRQPVAFGKRSAVDTFLPRAPPDKSHNSNVEFSGYAGRRVEAKAKLEANREEELSKIPTTGFPEHYFKFAAYNELEIREDVKIAISQFWSTVKVKTVNGEVQLQALVDGKKIVVTEASIRRDLQLEDAEGMDCLPNATIFKELTRMGAKTTAWNKFSSTMASAIIYLATNQKFNFSKYIFKNMVKNSVNEGKFIMYPRFGQVFLDNQLEGMETHDEIYIAPSYTKKVFGNMKRVRKGFSGNVTPLFLTMMVQAQQEQGEGLAIPTNP